MRLITVPRRPRVTDALLDQARQENLVLASAGGSQFVLAAINHFDRRIDLRRQNEELLELLDQHGREPPTITLKEAKAQLGLNEVS